MIAFFVGIIGGQRPVLVEGVLHAAAGMDGVGRPVVAVNQIPRSTGSVSGDATRAGGRRWIGPADEAARARGSIRRVDSLKRGGPSVLREIVVEHAKARADHGFAAVSGRICDAEPRAELRMVVVRHAHRNLQRLQRDERRILRLAAARSYEQAERRLITQPVIDREVRRHAPGIFRVEREPLHVLREAAVAGGSESRTWTRRIWGLVLLQ